jgi:regulatory protein
VEEDRRGVETAVRILARRDHSEAELARKLAARGIAATTVTAVLARLRELGYLDDRRFAFRFAEYAVTTGKGYGPRLRFELQRRGIAAEIVAEVEERVGETCSEADALAGVVTARFSRFDPAMATDREKRRIMQFLQRRGFSVGAIMRLFREGMPQSTHD